MGRMHVADFESGPFAGQTPRPQGRKTPLVGDFRQRIGLIHELAELRRAEEFANRRRRGLGVDQIVRHHGVNIDRAHAFADRAFHAQQADPVLVFHQFADGADAAVTKMVDIVDFASAVLELDHGPDHFEDVYLAQNPHRIFGFETEARVHLDPADSRKVVAIGIEEQAAEECLGGF